MCVCVWVLFFLASNILHHHSVAFWRDCGGDWLEPNAEQHLSCIIKSMVGSALTACVACPFGIVSRRHFTLDNFPFSECNCSSGLLNSLSFIYRNGDSLWSLMCVKRWCGMCVSEWANALEKEFQRKKKKKNTSPKNNTMNREKDERKIDRKI